MANPSVVTGPAEEPLKVFEAKAQTRVDFTTDDLFLADLIVAARLEVEAFLSRRLIDTTLDLKLDRFPNTDFITLPGGRLKSITSIKYTDSGNVESTFAATKYFAATGAEPGRAVLEFSEVWPSVTLKPREAVVVRYVAGYGANAAAVPRDIRQAIALVIGELYAHRGDRVEAPGERAPGQFEMPKAAERLLWRHRILDTV